MKFVGEELVAFTVSHASTRDDFWQHIVDKIPKRVRDIDKIAGICASVLQAPATWQEQTVTPLQLVAMLNTSKAHDNEVASLFNDGVSLTAEFAFMTIIDDMIIDYCERAASAGRRRELQTAAFWQQVPDVAASRGLIPANS